jgi:hypothetical protein
VSDVPAERSRTLISIQQVRSTRSRSGYKPLDLSLSHLVCWPSELAAVFPAPLILEIPHPEFAQLIATKRVIQKRGQNRSISQAFEGFLIGRNEQLAGLVIAESGRLAFVAFNSRALYPRCLGSAGRGARLRPGHRLVLRNPPRTALWRQCVRTWTASSGMPLSTHRLRPSCSR